MRTTTYLAEQDEDRQENLNELLNLVQLFRIQTLTLVECKVEMYNRDEVAPEMNIFPRNVFLKAFLCTCPC